VIADLNFWMDTLKPANPHEDGLMPLVLRLYEVMDQRLHAEGLGIGMVCARGPMTVASWLGGIPALMMELATNPDGVSKLLETVTTSIIGWLHAQLDMLHAPEGIMLLDDVVGMVSKRHYQAVIHPHLCRIFDEFDGLIRVYHNDTPCPHLLEVWPKPISTCLTLATKSTWPKLRLGSGIRSRCWVMFRRWNRCARHAGRGQSRSPGVPGERCTGRRSDSVLRRWDSSRHAAREHRRAVEAARVWSK